MLRSNEQEKTKCDVATQRAKGKQNAMLRSNEQRNEMRCCIARYNKQKETNARLQRNERRNKLVKSKTVQEKNQQYFSM